MRKGLLLVVLAICAAGAAWAGDINPPGGNVCGAGTIDTYDPATLDGEAHFDQLYDNLSVKIGNDEVGDICTDDDTEWPSANMPNRDYTYMMVKLHKPAGYTAGKLHWQLWADDQNVVFYCYRWNTGSSPHAWDYINCNDGGNEPPTETANIPASYFDSNGDMWLLFKATTTGSPDNILCDVVDIHY